MPRAQTLARVTELLEAGGPAGQRGQVPGAAVGRPAAAHRAGARAGHVARPAAARRAAVGARRDRARAAAPGDPRAAAQARRDHHHGHARPGRSASRGRPHRGDEPGRDRAGGRRRWRSTATRPRPSSPTSSAASTCWPPPRSTPAALRVGTHEFHCAHAFADGSELRVYLRPEDVLARPDRRRRPQRVRRQIEKIEFLGSVLPGARGAAGAGANTSSPCTCRSTSWPSSRSRSAAACRCALLPERMRIFE